MDTGTDNGFSRQRRNLVIASTFLLIYGVGDLTVDKFNLVLASGRVHDQSALLVLMWLIVAYFMYRFYTYSDRKVFTKFFEKINSSSKMQTKSAADRYVMMHFEELYNRHNIKKFTAPDYCHVASGTVEMSQVYPQVLPAHANNVSIKDGSTYDGRIFHIRAALVGYSDLVVQVIVNDLTATRLYFQSIFYFLFTDNFFGDKIFPYLFFYFASSWYLWTIFTSTATQTCP